MPQSSVLPSMRGILSGGNWKILKVTSGRSSPNCAGRNSKPRKAQRNHRLGIDLLHFNRTVSDRKSTRLNSSHLGISYAVFCLKKKNKQNKNHRHAYIAGAEDAQPTYTCIW